MALFFRLKSPSLLRLLHQVPLSSLKIHPSWTQKTGTFLNSIKLKWSPKHGRCIKYAFSLPVGYGLLTFKLHPKTALCAPKVKHSRLVKEDGGGGSDTKFDWKQFFQMLVPEMWYLLAAVIAAVAAALVNIKIPLLLGDLVNVVTNMTKEATSDFINNLKIPAIKLLMFYSVQGLLTFIYISLLSTVGENVAARMRIKLFDSLLRQDVEFF